VVPDPSKRPKSSYLRFQAEQPNAAPRGARSPRSRRWTGPRRSCRCGPGCRPRPPTTTAGTAPPPCSPRWRWPPARWSTPAIRGTARMSSSSS
jgi:hypothetical protein